MPTLDKYDPEPCLSLPEEAWCRIEHSLGLDEPDVGLRCRIARYIDIHFLGLTAKSPVRANVLRKQLERLRGDAAQLHSNPGPVVPQTATQDMQGAMTDGYPSRTGSRA